MIISAGWYEPCSFDEAIYAVACMTRRWRMGVVAHAFGSELFAFPHQTTSEIARSYQRMRKHARNAEHG